MVLNREGGGDSKALPESDSPLGYINASINGQVREYKSKRDRSRRAVLAGRVFAAGLAAIATVVLGLGSSQAFEGTRFTMWAPMIALVLSALMSLSASWEALRGHDWKWVAYRSTLFELYSLRDDIGFSIAGGRSPSDTQVSHYFDRLKRILEDTNDEWNLRILKNEKQDEGRRENGICSS